MFRILIFSLVFYSCMYANNNIKHSTYWITKSYIIGKNYALLIKENIQDYAKYSNSSLCNKYILQDIESNDKYFYSNYLKRKSDNEFTIKVFISCVNNINKYKNNRS